MCGASLPAEDSQDPRAPGDDSGSVLPPSFRLPGQACPSLAEVKRADPLSPHTHLPPVVSPELGRSRRSREAGWVPPDLPKNGGHRPAHAPGIGD